MKGERFKSKRPERSRGTFLAAVLAMQTAWVAISPIVWLISGASAFHQLDILRDVLFQPDVVTWMLVTISLVATWKWKKFGTYLLCFTLLAWIAIGVITSDFGSLALYLAMALGYFVAFRRKWKLFG
jgi:hypothetical protein